MVRRGVALPVVIICIVLALAFGVGVAVVWRTRYFDSTLPAAIKDFLGLEKSPLPSETSTETSSETPEDPTKDWKTYTNEELGFSFKYPGDWAVVSGAGLVNLEFGTGEGKTTMSFYKDFQGGFENASRTETQSYKLANGEEVLAVIRYREEGEDNVLATSTIPTLEASITMIYNFNLKNDPEGLEALSLLLSTFRSL